MDDKEYQQKQDRRTIDYVAIFTLLLVVGYLGGALYSLLNNASTFKDFSAAIGPLAGAMLGYWVRGANNASA